MAFSYGRQFRRIAAQALTADPDEMRASMERILPPRESGAPALRLETEVDYKIAPAVIVFAFFADALTGDEAADLLRQTENPAFRKQAMRGPRKDPLAASIPSWGAPARGEIDVTVRNARPARSHWDAPPMFLRDGVWVREELVNNNENTSAQPQGTAALENDDESQPAGIIDEIGGPAAVAAPHEDPANGAETSG
jgi:hypothetical protein